MCAGSFAAAVFDTNASDITEMPSSGDRCTRMPEYYTAVEQYRVGGGGKPRASTRSTRSTGKGGRVCTECYLLCRRPEQGHASTQTNADMCRKMD